MYKYLNIYTQYGMENSRKGKYPARGNPIQKHIYSPNGSLSMQPHTHAHTHTEAAGIELQYQWQRQWKYTFLRTHTLLSHPNTHIHTQILQYYKHTDV